MRWSRNPKVCVNHCAVLLDDYCIPRDEPLHYALTHSFALFYSMRYCVLSTAQPKENEQRQAFERFLQVDS